MIAAGAILFIIVIGVASYGLCKETIANHGYSKKRKRSPRRK